MNDINEIVKGKKYKYCLCIRTDGANFTNGIDCSYPEKILEMRCFDESGELRIFRSDVNDDFKVREMIEYPDYYDEYHYLDIDSVSEDGIVTATGGGKYFLPEKQAKLIKVRYYIEYDDNGIAKKVDWRLIGFCEKKEDKK